ncbi:FAD-dependent oxidoreductase [Paenibacillus athensensis]|nr:FAD-dependent oxidoreductase [Paenibacillus athensensis]MCD1258667.1 FAD-dependent oxidoreductase [Paenibacillus athensensis]
MSTEAGRATQEHIVVIGGGYAGLHVVHALRKQKGSAVRITLVDKMTSHLRKVMLFKKAVGDAELRIPFSAYFDEAVKVLQAELTAVDSAARVVELRRPDGSVQRLAYDRLALCLGSTVVAAEPEQGGVSLVDEASAARIRELLEQQLDAAARAPGEAEQRALLSVTVAGGGITGIETACELAHALRSRAGQLGIEPGRVTVTLVNASPRLMPDAPPKVGRRLGQELAALGVAVRHNSKAVRAEAERLVLASGETLASALCVWTLGARPSALAARLGLPVTPGGKLLVDAQYRVHGEERVYAIGDNAHIVDPATGRADGMTCKEAGPQAGRLAQIMLADAQGRSGPEHRGYATVFCISLGPERALVWMRKLGVDLLIGGKAGLSIRLKTWDMASLVDSKLK